MRIFENRYNRGFMIALCSVLIISDILLGITSYYLLGKISALILLISAAVTAAVILLCCRYFVIQDALIEKAALQTKRFLSGDTDARIECDEEGELFSFFQSVNTLSSVLNAQAERGKQNNEVLKTAISDISHQLKTPLAALNIYTGLIEETDNIEDARHFAASSEAELDRMEELVVNMLKLTRLDSGAIVFEKHPENIADIMSTLCQRFACRAELEGKTLQFEGADIGFPCDSSWLSEAFGNIIKNALDHTAEGGIIDVKWKKHGNILHVNIKDNGSGIHPDDIHNIFKRFYRSRFSKDTQGAGLGLPLAKAIIEAHSGTIEVESEPGRGTEFMVDFLIPSEL